MDRTTKTTVDIKRRGDVFEITVAGNSEDGIRRAVRAFVNSLLGSKQHDLEGCQITTREAVSSCQPTS
jgi:hypothetical protein